MDGFEASWFGAIYRSNPAHRCSCLVVHANLPCKIYNQLVTPGAYSHRFLFSAQNTRIPSVEWKLWPLPKQIFSISKSKVYLSKKNSRSNSFVILWVGKEWKRWRYANCRMLLDWNVWNKHRKQVSLLLISFRTGIFAHQQQKITDQGAPTSRYVLEDFIHFCWGAFCSREDLQFQTCFWGTWCPPVANPYVV